MTVVAEISVPAEEFAFGKALTVAGGTTVILEEIVPTGDAAMPYFWAENGDLQAFEREVGEESNITDLVQLDQLGDAALYRARWIRQDDGLLPAIIESDGVVLEAHSEGQTWHFRLRFSDRDALSDFYERCTDQGIAVSLDRVYTLTKPSRSGRAFGLTPEQREALELAVERGYFSVPGEATLGELADELDISRQALSKRIRRGNEKVLRAALLEPGTGTGT